MTVLEVPDLHSAIATRRRQPFSVGAEGDRVDLRVVPQPQIAEHTCDVLLGQLGRVVRKLPTCLSIPLERLRQPTRLQGHRGLRGTLVRLGDERRQEAVCPSRPRSSWPFTLVAGAHPFGVSLRRRLAFLGTGQRQRHGEKGNRDPMHV